MDLSAAEVSTSVIGKYVVAKENDEIQFKLYANNGQIICAGQKYKTAEGALNSINRFIDAVYSGEFYIYKDKNGKFQFKLFNTDKRLIVTGESYSTSDSAKNSALSCYRFAKNAVIDDQTQPVVVEEPVVEEASEN